MATKTKKATSAAPMQYAPPTRSLLEKGAGSHRTNNRLIIIYGPPKVRKTTSVSKLHGRKVKWLVSDPNCVPTLRALGRMPHPDDLYEMTSLQQAKDLLLKMLNVIEEHGVEGLDCEAVVLDSLTQFFDWHKDEISRITGQRYMGDNQQNNGWQQFNAEFGGFLDMLAQLARFVHVICIGHAVAKPNQDKALEQFKKKGSWAGLSLSPGMAEKAGRLANWVLYQTLDTRYVDKDEPDSLTSDDFITAELLSNGSVKHTEVIIHTTTFDVFSASVNSRMVDKEGGGTRPVLEAEEPGDLDFILVKEGLLEAR